MPLLFGSAPPVPEATGAKEGKIKLTNDLGGTATAPTVTNLHLAGDTAIGHKLTSLTNGSSAQDAAAFGQIPTALPPNGSASGDLTGSYPAPTIKSSVGLTGNPTATTQTAGDSSNKIATDAFVTAAINTAIAGVNPAVAAAAATTSASDTSALTYNNGAAGIGATLTGANNVALTVDGFTFTALGQRLLVKNDTQAPSGALNGIYYVTQLQAALLPLILTRALDYDMPSDMNNTGAIPVTGGTVNAITSWVLTSQITTVGTDPLTYTKFTVNPSTLLTNGLTSGHLFVGNVSNVATDTAMTGDVSISNTGVTALAAIVSGTTIGSTTQIPVITYDSKGRITGSTTATPTASTQRTFAYYAG